MEMIVLKVGIVGANGYGGAELLRLLHHHPYIEIENVVSHSTKGTSLTKQYPHFTKINNMKLEDLNQIEINEEIDLLFFSTPSGVTKEMIPYFLEKGKICIDLSGDYRLKDGQLYEKWYKKSPAPSYYLQKAVYGLCEVNRKQLQLPEVKLIANPGCYPTATLLGLIPALKEKLIDPDSIIIDAKSGVSGAGRSPSLGNLFAEINENMKAYKLGEHQHIPEIEQVLEEVYGEHVNISFTTHLIPMTRGIMCTMYANLTKEITTEEMTNIYRLAYEDEHFIRIYSPGESPATKNVSGSNFCDIGLKVDKRTNRLIIVSVIDNLVKGAAGQAIQNMNLINGWDERTGLEIVPLFP